MTSIRGSAAGAIPSINGAVMGSGEPLISGAVDLVAVVDDAAGTVTLTLGPGTTVGITQAWILPPSREPFILPIGGATYSIASLIGGPNTGDLEIDLLAAPYIAPLYGAGRVFRIETGQAPPVDPDPEDPVISSMPSVSWSPAAQEGATPTFTPGVVTGADAGAQLLVIQADLDRDGVYTDTTAGALAPFPAISGGDVNIRLGMRYALGAKTFEIFGSPIAVRDLSVPATILSMSVISTTYVAGQTLYYRPRITIPSLNAVTPYAVQWTTNGGATQNKVVEVGTTNEYTLSMSDPADDGVFDPERFDFAAFTDAESARRSRFQLRWQETNGGPWSAWSAEFTIPAYFAPGGDAMPALAADDVTRLLSVPNLASFEMDITPQRNQAGYPGTQFGSGVMAQNAFHQTTLLAYEYARNPAGAAANVKAKVLAQVRHWAAAGSTAIRSRLPTGEGGYNAQHAGFCYATIAMIARTPMWTADLTADERARLSAVMEGALYGVSFSTSDRNTREALVRTLQGFSCYVEGNPNFSFPNHVVPYICASFFGFAEASAMLDSFSRAAWMTKMENVFATHLGVGGSPRPADTVDMYTLWRDMPHDWRAPVGPVQVNTPGPSVAYIEGALKAVTTNNVTRRWRNVTYAQPMTQAGAANVLQQEWEKIFGAPIQPGIDNNDPATRAANPFGRLINGTWAGRIVDTGRWAGLPNFTTPRTIGAEWEFVTVDGRGGRSSPGYVNDGTRIAVALVLTCHVLGIIDLTDSRWDTAITRTIRSMTDTRYKYGGSGYRGTSHGGVEGIFTWGAADANDTDYLRAIFNVGDQVLPGLR
jgi:hypothetical protein